MRSRQLRATGLGSASHRRRPVSIPARIPWIPVFTGMTDVADVYLPRHGGGDQRRAIFLQALDGLFNLCHHSVDLVCFAVEVIGDGMRCSTGRRRWTTRIVANCFNVYMR